MSNHEQSYCSRVSSPIGRFFARSNGSLEMVYREKALQQIIDTFDGLSVIQSQLDVWISILKLDI